MTSDSLKERLSRRPFEPFRVVTSSGEQYDVRHPENALLYKSGLIVANRGDNGDLPESYADLALLQITAIEKLPTVRRRGLYRKRR